MFGCITDTGVDVPVYKKISLDTDHSFSGKTEYKPLVPDGKFIQETYDPEFITTSLESSTKALNNIEEETALFNVDDNNIGIEKSQRILITKDY